MQIEKCSQHPCAFLRLHVSSPLRQLFPPFPWSEDVAGRRAAPSRLGSRFADAHSPDVEPFHGLVLRLGFGYSLPIGIPTEGRYGEWAGGLMMAEVRA